MTDSMSFDGSTYEPKLDKVRLTRQMKVIFRIMLDNKWHTLSGLSQQTGFSEASISARIRDLRKPRFGLHTVDRTRLLKLNDQHYYDPTGRFEYRLTVNAKANVTLEDN